MHILLLNELFFSALYNYFQPGQGSRYFLSFFIFYHYESLGMKFCLNCVKIACN